jgi:hypothetical protein
VVQTDFSSDGQTAELIDSAFSYRIRITNSVGQITTDTVLARNEVDVRDFFFSPDGSIYLTGTLEVEPFPGILLKFDQHSGTVTRRIFNGPDDPPGLVTFSAHHFNGDQLILAGMAGRSLITDAYAIGIDQWDNVRWRFRDGIRFGMNWINGITTNPNAPEEIYLTGRAGVTDVTPTDERTFIIKLSSLPTSTMATITRPIELFPNPVNDQLTLKGLPSKVREIEVINVAGRVVTRRVSGQKIDVRMLPAGTYFLRAEAAGERFLGKFVKQ